MDRRRHDQWTGPARSWALRGSPLRPSPEDIDAYGRAIGRWRARGGAAQPRVTLLGVTSEIVAMPWPAGTRMIAVDQSAAMIASLWTGAARGYDAVCARWQALPLPDGSQDIAIGDGCHCVLGAEQYAPLTGSLRRLLHEAGLLVLRLFVRPERAETPDRVFEDLHAARIGSFHAFKWRLAMAMHGSLSDGVRLADIWEAWHAAVPEPGAIARRLGWRLAEILTIDDFRGLDARYTFPTLAEARASVAPCFVELACHFPSYELGERCPILAWRPRHG